MENIQLSLTVWYNGRKSLSEDYPRTEFAIGEKRTFPFSDGEHSPDEILSCPEQPQNMMHSYQKEYIDLLLSYRASNSLPEQIRGQSTDYFFQGDSTIRLTSYTPRASDEVKQTNLNPRFSIGQGCLVFAEKQPGHQLTSKSSTIHTEDDVKVEFDEERFERKESAKQQRLRNSELNWLGHRTFRSSRNIRDLLQPNVDTIFNTQSPNTSETNVRFQKKDLGTWSFLHQIFRWKSPEPLPETIGDDFFSALDPVPEPTAVDLPVPPIPYPKYWRANYSSVRQEQLYWNRNTAVPKRSFLLRRFKAIAERKFSFGRVKTRSSEIVCRKSLWSLDTDTTSFQKSTRNTSQDSLPMTTVEEETVCQYEDNESCKPASDDEFSGDSEEQKDSKMSLRVSQRKDSGACNDGRVLVERLGEKLCCLEEETRMSVATELMRSLHPDQVK